MDDEVDAAPPTVGASARPDAASDGNVSPGVCCCKSDWAASMAVAESMPLAAATAAKLGKAAAAAADEEDGESR